MWSKGSFQDNEVENGVGQFRETNKPTGNYQNLAVNAGLGVTHFLNENVAIRIETLDTFAHETADHGRDNGGYHNLAVTGGLAFQLGGNN